MSWSGDVNDAAVETWVSETTPFERVHEVLRTTVEPETAAELADRAQLVARAALELWRRAYETDDLGGLNTATNPP